MTTTPAGWYPTPDGQQRYWDGERWTEHTAPAAAASGTTAAEPLAGAGASVTGADARPVWKKKRVLIPSGLLGLAILGAAVTGGGEQPVPAAVSTPSTSATAPAAGVTPAPSPSPSATAAAVVEEEAAPSPYDEAFGTFKVVSKAGRGDSVVKLPAGATAGIVTMTHSGSSNFAVNVLDSKNQATGDLLANEIGKFKGSAAYGLSSLSDDGVKLKVTADGKWSIKIRPISSAAQLGASHQGSGPAVLLYDGGAADWVVAHKGDSNFAVNQVGGDFPNLAVNEIGAYKGTVPLNEGPSVVMISADGTWSFTRQ